MFKKLKRILLLIISLPFLYGIASLVCTYIEVPPEPTEDPKNKVVYLSSNGVHVDIVLPVKQLSPALHQGLNYKPYENFLAFGWGDQGFYLNTPIWDSLTFKNATRALFLRSPTLVHVTRYIKLRKDWVPVALSESQLERLNEYVEMSFKLNAKNKKIWLEGQGYTPSDDFYEGLGSYTCFYTCNTWVNEAMKACGAKSCFWTPYSFQLLQMNRETPQ